MATTTSTMTSANKDAAVFVPKMSYLMVRGSAHSSYEQIRFETSEFKGIDPNFVSVLQERLYSRPEAFFAVLPAPSHVGLCKRIIGQQGYYLKLTTAATGAYFIWHCRESNTFMFWAGNRINLVKAMNAIRWRIFKNIGLLEFTDEEKEVLEREKLRWRNLDHNSDTA